MAIIMGAVAAELLHEYKCLNSAYTVLRGRPIGRHTVLSDVAFPCLWRVVERHEAVVQFSILTLLSTVQAKQKIK